MKIGQDYAGSISSMSISTVPVSGEKGLDASPIVLPLASKTWNVTKNNPFPAFKYSLTTHTLP